MPRPRTAQELIHWLELGAGARWIRFAAAFLLLLALSLRVAWSQFRGPVTETTLVQADTGRQLARGQGFTTLVNYPQTAAFLKARGVRFDPAQPYPELHHAPLYPLTIAAALRVLPASTRDNLFSTPPAPPDGYRADYFLLALNLLLLWLAAALTYALGSRLFEPRVGWVAALALLLSASVWQRTVAVNGTPLLMVLVLLAFCAWFHVEAAAAATEAHAPGASSSPPRPPFVWLAILGVLCGLLFLTEYTAGALVFVALAYAILRFRTAPVGLRTLAVVSVVLGFAVVAGPWIARNLSLTGSPVALAIQDVALKAGDPTAEPATALATLSAELPRIELRKLGNKTLSSLQQNLQSQLWSGGATWLTAFFAAGWLYAFRSAAANRLRWVFTAALGILLLAQAALNAGDSERLVAVWTAPLIMIFGAGFFFVLLGSNTTLSAWPRLSATALLAVLALPLAQDVLEPRRVHFQYPPYFPTLLRGLPVELERRGQLGRYGIMADIPAGVAWYGQTRAWGQPPVLRDFYAITLEQTIGELLLTPRTLDRPFFSELNARSVLPAQFTLLPSRYGEWGAIYGGLLTGSLPREFPLGSPQKLAENLYVLVNSSLPPPRGR